MRLVPPNFGPVHEVEKDFGLTCLSPILLRCPLDFVTWSSTVSLLEIWCAPHIDGIW